MRNYSGDITGSNGFYASSLGGLPTQCTLTQWFRFATYDCPINRSKTTFKYGDRNSGVGYGTERGFDDKGYVMCAGLVEGKYWSGYTNPTDSAPTDFSWHHLAFMIKAANSPLYNTVYLDGNLLTPKIFLLTAPMTSPTGFFSLCGRDGSSDFETNKVDVRVTRTCIFGRLFTASDIMADYSDGMSMPKDNSLLHYWDATVENGKVVDKVGDWNLSFSNGCSISDDTPWTWGGGNLLEIAYYLTKISNCESVVSQYKEAA